MQGKPNIPETGKISVYLPKEDWDYILENYEAISKTDEPIPWGKFFMAAMTAAMATRKPDSNPDDKKRIQELVGQVDQLTEDNDKLKLANDMLVRNNKKLQEDLSNSFSASLIDEKNEAIDQLEHDKKKLYEEKARIEGELLSFRQSNSIPANSVLVSLTEKSIAVIHEICKNESERMNSEVTPDLLFKNVMFHVIANGPHDMFKAPISVKRIREISNTVKNISE